MIVLRYFVDQSYDDIGAALGLDARTVKSRLFTARQVVEQRGTIQPDYTVARTAAEQFYARLRQLFARREYRNTRHPLVLTKFW